MQAYVWCRCYIAWLLTFTDAVDDGLVDAGKVVESVHSEHVLAVGGDHVQLVIVNVRTHADSKCVDTATARHINRIKFYRHVWIRDNDIMYKIQMYSNIHIWFNYKLRVFCFILHVCLIRSLVHTVSLAISKFKATNHILMSLSGSV